MKEERRVQEDDEMARYLELIRLDAALFHVGALLEALGHKTGPREADRIRRSLVPELGRIQAVAYAQMARCAGT